MDHLQNINEILQKPWDAPSYAVWFSLTKTKTKMVKNEKITNSLTKTKTKTKNKSKRKSHCSYGLVSGKVDDIISCAYWHATRPLVDGCVIWLIQWHIEDQSFEGLMVPITGVIGQRGPRDSPWSGIRGKAPWSWTFFAFAILHNLAGLLICRRNYFFAQQKCRLTSGRRFGSDSRPSLYTGDARKDASRCIILFNVLLIIPKRMRHACNSLFTSPTQQDQTVLSRLRRP